MVRSAGESGRNPVILLCFYFRRLTVSHFEKKEDKNKNFSISHNTAHLPPAARSGREMFLPPALPS